MRFKYLFITLLHIFLLPSLMGSLHNMFYMRALDINNHKTLVVSQLNVNKFQKKSSVDTHQINISEDYLFEVHSHTKINQPLKTPRPTPTPLVIPPPADPNSSNLIVIFGILSVLIVLVGVWANRHRLE